MGFLHKLWDETLAGPAPDKALRKYHSFSAARSHDPQPQPPPPLDLDRVIIPPHEDDHHQIPVSRSITILRTHSANYSADSCSLPSSPAGSSTPSSPFSPTVTPRGDFRRFTRRKSRPEPQERAEPISPTVYDWIVINALDR